MQASAHQAKGFVEVDLVLAFLVAAAELDTVGKELSDMLGRGHNVTRLKGNVLFHAGALVNGKLSFLVDGATEAVVVLAGVDIVGVILGVVNVVFGAVAADSIGSDFEFSGAVSKSHETKDAEEQTDGFGRDRLDGTDVDGLGVVAEPVAKVDTGDHDLVEIFARKGVGHGEGEQGILDVTVAPWLEG